MPSKSKAQSRLMHAAESMKKGEQKPKGKAGEIAKTMSKKELGKFTSTNQKGLPERKKSKEDNEHIKGAKKHMGGKCRFPKQKENCECSKKNKKACVKPAVKGPQKKTAEDNEKSKKPKKIMGGLYCSKKLKELDGQLILDSDFIMELTSGVKFKKKPTGLVVVEGKKIWATASSEPFNVFQNYYLLEKSIYAEDYDVEQLVSRFNDLLAAAEENVKRDILDELQGIADNYGASVSAVASNEGDSPALDQGLVKQIIQNAKERNEGNIHAMARSISNLEEIQSYYEEQVFGESKESEFYEDESEGDDEEKEEDFGDIDDIGSFENVSWEEEDFGGRDIYDTGVDTSKLETVEDDDASSLADIETEDDESEDEEEFLKPETRPEMDDLGFPISRRSRK